MVEQVVGLRFVVEGEREATKALKAVSDSQSKLSRDILRGVAQVKSLGSEWDRANKYLKEGTITASANREVQIRLAREYAILNNMVKANGALNTQAALSQMRAAQAAREDAAATAAQAATKTRLTQSYNQLLASINPVIAAQQRTRQTVDMLRAAVAAGSITTQQAAQALLQYRAALRATGAAGQQAALGMNRFGVLTQQAGYQFGDFAVQVQSGTNVMVALGQQATQLIGTFAMLSRSTRNIVIFSALGVVVPILTAIGAGFIRSGNSAGVFADIVDNRLSSLEPVFRGIAISAGKIGDGLSVLGGVAGKNLDKLLVAATLVAGFFAGKFLIATSAAQTAITAVGVAAINARATIASLGVVAGVSSLGMSGLTMATNLLRMAFLKLVLPLAAVFLAVEGVMFVIRQFKKDADEAASTDLEKTLEQLGEGSIKVDKTMEALTKSVDAYRSATEDANQSASDLTKEFGSQAVEMKRLYEEKRRLAEIEARIAAASAVNIGFAIDSKAVRGFVSNVQDIVDKYDELENVFSSGINVSGRNPIITQLKAVSNFAKELNLTKIGALEFASALSEAQDAAASGDTARMADSVKNLQAALNAAIIPGQELPKQMLEYLQSLVKGEISLREFLVLQEASAQAQGRSNSLMDEAVKKYNDIKASAEGRIAQYERETALNQAILDYGRNSVQVEELKRVQVMAVVEAMIKQEQLGDELAKRMRDAAAAAYDTSVAVDSINLSPALAQANAFADAMGRARSNASGIGISTAGINAQIAALESGASQVEARAQGAAETVRARLTAELPAADRGSKSSDRIDRVVQQTYEEELKKGIATERLQKLTATTSSGGASSGGAGKSNVIDIQEIIAKRNEQIAQERVLLGLTGQQRAEMEIYYDLTKGMSDEQLASSEQFVMAEAKKIAALQQTNDVLKEQQAEQQQIADTLQSSMSDAFMSMVDGTKSFKDAMKDMARAVIKQLFDVLVVQRLVGSFNATTGVGSGLVGAIMGAFQADGGAWRAGSQITAYANGGVVGGPTYFPMSGGKTGLMGEAGPEAIMPLKRGKDGKLGVAADGGGAVTVVQHFNFSANGDDSVKKIIAQAAPQIANMTQKQIMDSRRRGGAMKTAFG